MKTKIDRIQKDLETLATFTATPGNGVTRVSYSKEDILAKNYLLKEIENMGLKYTVDGYGTIFAKKEGTLKDAPSVMFGSHYDTVYNGGAFDGAAGVVGALEAMRVLVENNYENDYPVELIIMNAEEGGIFGPCTGVSNSRAMMGTMSEWELDNKRNKEGKTKREAMKEYGLDVDLSKAKRDPKTIKNFLEMHIEQGPHLDRLNKEIGLIEFLGGIGRYWVRFKGVSGDSTIKMSDRKDALVAACAFSYKFDEMIKTMGEDVTGMVGQMAIEPNSSQFVPGYVEGKIEIRTFTKEACDKYDYNQIISNLLKEVSEKYGVETELEEIRRINYQNPTYPSIMNKDVLNTMKEVCDDLSLTYMTMHNGTGHDSMIMCDYVDTNMIYVPSRNNGASHCPEEWSEYSDVQKGADVLLNTIMRISKK